MEKLLDLIDNCNPVTFLIVIAAVFIIAICWYLRHIGSSSFDTYYRYLECSVRFYPVNQENYTDIVNSFLRIKTFRFRNKEKINVLETEFKNRFAEIIKSDNTNQKKVK